MQTYNFTPVSVPHSIRGNYKTALLMEQLVSAITGLVSVAPPSALYPPGTLIQHPEFSVTGGTDPSGIAASVTITMPDAVTRAQVNAVISAHDSQDQTSGELSMTALVNARTSGKLKLRAAAAIGLTDMEILALFG